MCDIRGHAKRLFAPVIFLTKRPAEQGRVLPMLKDKAAHQPACIKSTPFRWHTALTFVEAKQASRDCRAGTAEIPPSLRVRANSKFFPYAIRQPLGAAGPRRVQPEALVARVLLGVMPQELNDLQ